MAITVQSIMNRELIAVMPGESVGDALELMHSFCVSTVPVLDGFQRPIGVLSLRDRLDLGGLVEQRMSKPAICVALSCSVEEAARHLAQLDKHHLVVVDSGGRAVGMVSSLDLLRALCGLPPRHPPTFPHWDQATHVSWTDEILLNDDDEFSCPEGPGVLVLISGVLGEPERVVWVQAIDDLRTSIRSFRRERSELPPALRLALERPGLRYRFARIYSTATREKVAEVLWKRMESAPPPGSN